MDNRRLKDTANIVQVTESCMKQIRKVHGDISHFIYRDEADERNVYIVDPKYLSSSKIVPPYRSLIESFVNVAVTESSKD